MSEGLLRNIAASGISLLDPLGGILKPKGENSANSNAHSLGGGLQFGPISIGGGLSSASASANAGSGSASAKADAQGDGYGGYGGYGNANANAQASANSNAQGTFEPEKCK